MATRTKLKTGKGSTVEPVLAPFSPSGQTAELMELPKQDSPQPLQYRLASIPRRLLAFFIDFLILGVAGFLLSSFLFKPDVFESAAGAANSWGVNDVLLFFVLTIVSAFYWVVSEGLFGVTIGKKLLKLRVVKESGEPIGYARAFIRNLWKFIGGLHILGPLEGALMFVTQKKQRLLDVLVKTVVVRVDLAPVALREDFVKASFAERFVARLLDGLILLAFILVSILAALIAIVAVGSDIGYILISAFVLWYLHAFLMEPLYFISFTAMKGQTPGKNMLKLKVYSTENETPVGWKKAIMRYLGYLASILYIYLGYLWIIVDKDKRGWHDKFADTIVVKEEDKSFDIKKPLLYFVVISVIAGVFVGLFFSVISPTKQSGASSDLKLMFDTSYGDVRGADVVFDTYYLGKPNCELPYDSSGESLCYATVSAGKISETDSHVIYVVRHGECRKWEISDLESVIYRDPFSPTPIYFVELDKGVASTDFECENFRELKEEV